MPTTKILSAFCRDAIPGSVYIEAPSLGDVLAGLRGIAGIYCSKRRVPRTFPVTLADRVALLRMSIQHSINVLSWVRIKHGVTYRGDLALVSNVSLNNAKAVVLLVPRIAMDRKRKRSGHGRPPARLFNPEDVKQVYGAAVQQRGQVFELKGSSYTHGLLEREFNISDLSSSTHPTAGELELFRGSQDERVLKALSTGVVTFETGDLIEVVSGPLLGTFGKIVDIHSNGTVVFEMDNAEVANAEVLVAEISKKFRLGQLVVVKWGIHKGKYGYITALNSTSAFLYERAAPDVEYRVAGEEVS